MTQSQSGNIW